MANSLADEHVAFHKLLHEQIGREFTAAQQYISIAIYFDSNHLPQLANRFYTQGGEEREHAMMIVQYLLDRDREVKIGGVDPVVAEFESIRDAVALALEQEQEVTRQITTLTVLPGRATISLASVSCSGFCRSKSRKLPV